jgi:hypothetical protein
MPALGDYDDEEINGMMIVQRKPKYPEKSCPSAALFTTKHHTLPRS